MSTTDLQRRARSRAPHRALLLFAFATATGCQFDRSTRWNDQEVARLACSPGAVRCAFSLERCELVGGNTAAWKVLDDCPAKGLVCASALQACTKCTPSRKYCEGTSVSECSADGQSSVKKQDCEGSPTSACRDGSCVDLCAHAALTRSNVGCEYWAADLDNAMIDATSNAAAQQYAIVVSNPQPDLPAQVVIEQDDSSPGREAQISVAAKATIQPLNLRVFKLGPREVDGSPEGEFDTGTGTALTRQAYRITSSVPVVAYQFNPLDNVGVFSNDASLLKPAEALVNTPGTFLPAYVVVGWPQTIAATDDPETNFNPAYPIDLRAFITLIATRPNTHVRVVPSTRVIPGGDIPETQPGSPIDVTMQPFDVLNLESGGFNADFSGSIVDSDQPVVLFSGNEASDAPYFSRLAERFCCADHLEEQLDPIRTAGKTFIAPHSPSRTRAVSEAGGELAIADEPEYFRVMAVDDLGPTLVSTTLLPPDDVFTLPGRGTWRDITVRHGELTPGHRDFVLTADRPVVLANVQPSQDAAYVRRGLPGGDPSLMIVPPMEQYRTRYVFLTPDKYMFDFITIMGPRDATVLLDGNPLDSYGCSVSPADGLNEEERGKPLPDFVVYRCQLSFPTITATEQGTYEVVASDQNDGVHRVDADSPVMVLVYGFDSYVSYGYAAGTQLEAIGPPK